MGKYFVPTLMVHNRKVRTTHHHWHKVKIGAYYTPYAPFYLADFEIKQSSHQ